MVIKVTIQQHHIDNGRKKHCHLCPIALAISEWLRANEMGHHVSVGIYGVYLRTDPYSEKSTYWASMPDNAKGFILDFDHGVELPEGRDFVFEFREKTEISPTF